MTPTSSEGAPHPPIDIAPTEKTGSLPDRSPRDFGQLARRISSRTTDLFAVALVAVVLLYLGAKITRWWRAEPPKFTGALPAASPLAVWDDPAALSLEFTTADWSLLRETVAGSDQEVTALAVDRARRTLATIDHTDLPPVDPAEEQWLDRLRDWPPHSRSDRGDVFVLGGPWPWIVATTPMNPAAGDASVAAAGGRRILGWALAFPQADDRWTLYAADRMTAGQTAAGATGDVPLPPDATRLLSVHSTTGGFATFRSATNRRRCQDDWDRQLIAAGWVRDGDWRIDGDQSSAVYRRGHAALTDRLDVLLCEASDGGTTGGGDWRRQPEDSGPP